MRGVCARTQRRLNTYKAREGLAIFELGVDVNLDRVKMLSKRELVERVEFAKMNRGELLD